MRKGIDLPKMVLWTLSFLCIPISPARRLLDDQYSIAIIRHTSLLLDRVSLQYAVERHAAPLILGLDVAIVPRPLLHFRLLDCETWPQNCVEERVHEEGTTIVIFYKAELHWTVGETVSANSLDMNRSGILADHIRFFASRWNATALDQKQCIVVLRVSTLIKPTMKRKHSNG